MLIQKVCCFFLFQCLPSTHFLIFYVPYAPEVIQEGPTPPNNVPNLCTRPLSSTPLSSSVCLSVGLSVFIQSDKSDGRPRPGSAVWGSSPRCAVQAAVQGAVPVRLGHRLVCDVLHLHRWVNAVDWISRPIQRSGWAAVQLQANTWGRLNEVWLENLVSDLPLTESSTDGVKHTAVTSRYRVQLQHFLVWHFDFRYGLTTAIFNLRVRPLT